ncbi:uncharacterized protein LOC119831092 [Zerene cesonia]|uniref:uncharacterized protein LOC119831092 n=1 Tax=Zerene cesonia TaxID=33412 RepID=UPI0018E54DA4|nr:uncharacterized protein LOC119831092 [Zerene cesonia]
MKNITAKQLPRKSNSKEDDDNVRYKLSKQYLNNIAKANSKALKKYNENDDNIRYKFAPVSSRPKTPEKKPKQKPKIKVNFWSNKQIGPRNQKEALNSAKSKRRHTVSIVDNVDSDKPKTPTIKVRKRVSFLPSPMFTDNHVPMVTVPDDLTIQINAEEAKTLGEDLNLGFVDNKTDISKLQEQGRKKVRTSMTQTSPRSTKVNATTVQQRNQGNENDLEFFSKYVVQKLRRMETNQRIYSENLINTVLMLGQLGQLNGKSKITQT